MFLYIYFIQNSLRFLTIETSFTFGRQPPRQPPQPRATLVILDRSLDHASPLLHEFTYQAMITDLLPVEPSGTALKYNYEYGQSDGTTGAKEVVLDESDTIYTSVRHLHIAETTDKLIENFNKFLHENKAALSAR